MESEDKYVPSNAADFGKMHSVLSTSDNKPLVIIESPYAGDIERNLRYVRAAMRDSIVRRGEVPFASHALYTQPGVLRDEIPEERELGMGLGWYVMRHASYVAVYMDLGFSSGMIRGVRNAVSMGRPVVGRFLPFDNGFKTEWYKTVPSFEKVPEDVIRAIVIEQE